MKGKARLVTYDGETLSLTGWAKKLGIPLTTMHSRMRKWGIERAVETGPSMERRDPRWRNVKGEKQVTVPPPPRGTTKGYPNPHTAEEERAQERIPGCPICGLRGEHECLRGSATAGLGQWSGAAWGRWL